MPLRSNLRLIRLATTAELRNPGLRLLATGGAVAGAAYAWSGGPLAATTATVLSTWMGRVLGMAACLWFSYAAIRDQDAKLGAVLRSKPVDGGRWVFLTWASGLFVWLALLAVVFLAAGFAQVFHAGLLSLLAHGLGFARAALVVGAMGTISFALSRMVRSPLGGVMTLFAWFCALAGVQYVPHYLKPDLLQNLPLFLAVGGLLLSLAALLVERFRRGELRRPLPGIAAVLALGLLAAAGAVRAYHAAPAQQAKSGLAQGIERQHLEVGKRVPGFWLSDGRGGTLRTSDYHGRILLIYLFDPQDAVAARTLTALNQIARELGDRGVQPLGVCLSQDHADGLLAARAGGYRFPIGSDPTVVSVSPPESAVALAYHPQMLPHLVVTDRRRRVRAELRDVSHDAASLRRIVEERLREEPE